MISSILRSLRENLLLKIIALGASILIWLYVSADLSPIVSATKTVNAEIVPVGPPPENLILNVRTDTLQIEITGPKIEVDRVVDGEIKAEIDVRGIRANTPRLPVVNYRRPQDAPNVRVIGTGRTVSVEVVARERKRFQIVPQFNPDTTFDRRYSPPRLTPESVVAVGSRDDLKRVDKITVQIETNGRGLNADLPLIAIDKDGIEVENVKLEQKLTHVDLALPEAPATKTLIVNVPIRGKAADPFQVSEVIADPDQVVVSGKPEQLLQMTNVSTEVVSVEGLMSNVTRDVPLQLPAGVTVRRRPVVSVTVRVRDTSKVTGPPIRPDNP